MRVGLFGGSFDPIHNSHVKIVEEVLRKGLVDEVWIIPCFCHNFGKGLASFDDRVKMIQLSISRFSKVKISSIEKELGGVNKTYDTVAELKKRFDYNFFWICGSDCIEDLKKWYRWEDLVKEIQFIIYDRENFNLEVNPKVKILEILDHCPDNLSSTEIRARIKNNEDVSKSLPKEVLGYINEMGLYK